MTRVTVLGIGNTLMGDDGVGAVVVRQLAPRHVDDEVRVIERSAADMGLVRYFLDSERIVVVDAMDAGAEPGSVFRFDPDDAGVTALRSNNIHGMGVGYLLTNARLIGARPEVIVYGVQVGDVRPRPDELSGPVRDVVDTVTEMIEQELAGQPPPLLAATTS